MPSNKLEKQNAFLLSLMLQMQCTCDQKGHTIHCSSKRESGEKKKQTNRTKSYSKQHKQSPKNIINILIILKSCCFFAFALEILFFYFVLFFFIIKLLVRISQTFPELSKWVFFSRKYSSTLLKSEI